MSTVNIDGKDYHIDSLPDQAKANLQLIQVNNQKINQAQIDMGLAQAAAAELGAQLKLSLKGVKPIPQPRVKTGEAGGNRQERRATAATKAKPKPRSRSK